MEVIKTYSDFYTTPGKAFQEIDSKWESYPGLVVYGSHNPTDVDLKMDRIRDARENGIPFLGICMGMQLAMIEYAQNVLQLDVTSQEINPTQKNPLFVQMNQKRTGAFPVNGKLETHWHQYMFNNKYEEIFSKEWKLYYEGNILEMAILHGHPFFLGVQYHPEYQSMKGNPHPLLKQFIQVCKTGSAGGLRL